MKTILIILLLAALALLADLELAALGMALVAFVLLIGDLVQAMPAPACNQDCNQDCNQGDTCTCRRSTP